jgi:hypothetical protein
MAFRAFHLVDKMNYLKSEARHGKFLDFGVAVAPTGGL